MRDGFDATGRHIMFIAVCKVTASLSLSLSLSLCFSLCLSLSLSLSDFAVRAGQENVYQWGAQTANLWRTTGVSLSVCLSILMLFLSPGVHFNCQACGEQ
jgi:hypothetical protein